MHEVAFLFDVDNTLIDNDRAVADFHEELDGLVGAEIAKGYWALFELVRKEVGHADYLEALQRFRMTHPRLPQLLELSKYLLRYPFANRLFPRSLDVVTHVAERGPAALLSDGDAVFQPWKVWTSGLYEAVKGRVLIYQAKETCLADVEARLPA